MRLLLFFLTYFVGRQIMAFIDKAKSLILDYYMREFGTREARGEFQDLTDVGLMYTHYYVTDDFSGDELKRYNVSVAEQINPCDHQVSVNLLDKVIRVEINGKIVSAVQCTEEQMLEFLDCMDFESLMWMPEEAHPKIIDIIRQEAA